MSDLSALWENGSVHRPLGRPRPIPPEVLDAALARARAVAAVAVTADAPVTAKRAPRVLRAPDPPHQNVSQVLCSHNWPRVEVHGVIRCCECGAAAFTFNGALGKRA